jgi:hypothetical protein
VRKRLRHQQHQGRRGIATSTQSYEEADDDTDGNALHFLLQLLEPRDELITASTTGSLRASQCSAQLFAPAAERT